MASLPDRGSIGTLPRTRMAKKSSRIALVRRVFRTILLTGIVAVGAVGYVVYREVSEDLPPDDPESRGFLGHDV